MTDNKKDLVTEASWQPGLPPPIEALQQAFPERAGYTIEYGESVQRDPASEDGWQHTPVAIVRSPSGWSCTFYPSNSPG